MQNETIEIQKITAHIPKHLLQEAQVVTHKGITETIKIALNQLAKAHEKSRSFKGKAKFSINLNQLRED